MDKTSITIGELPAMGQPLLGGTFAGLTTTRDGSHVAVVLLDDKSTTRLTWQQAKAWAESVSGTLATRPVAALLFANVNDRFAEDWYWTADEHSASYAWYCNFDDGDQSGTHKSYEGCARAVRLIPLAA